MSCINGISQYKFLIVVLFPAPPLPSFKLLGCAWDSLLNAVSAKTTSLHVHILSAALSHTLFTNFPASQLIIFWTSVLISFIFVLTVGHNCIICAFFTSQPLLDRKALHHGGNPRASKPSPTVAEGFCKQNMDTLSWCQ